MSGMSAIPENKSGMPMTRPEKLEPPPRCSTYKLEEDTIIKNEIC